MIACVHTIVRFPPPLSLTRTHTHTQRVQLYCSIVGYNYELSKKLYQVIPILHKATVLFVITLTDSSSCLSVVGTEGLCSLGGAGLLAGSFGFCGGFVPECVLYKNDIQCIKYIASSLY